MEGPTVSMRGERAGAPAAIDFLGERYDIGKLLGSGGQGEVYRVFDRRLRRRMVMKVLSPDYLGDPISLARSVQEASTGRTRTPSA